MTGGGPNLVIGAEPSLSLADVEKLLRDHDDPRIVKAIGHVFGVVVSLVPAWTGPPGFVLWSLLDVKDELVGGLTHLLPFLTRKRDESYLDRLQRLKMAVTTLVYVAFVEEASEAVKQWCTEEDLTALRADEHAAPMQPDDMVPNIVLRRPPAIGPMVGFADHREFAKHIYDELTQGLVNDVRWQPHLRVGPSAKDQFELVGRAVFRFEAAFVELCANHDELLLWAQCDAALRGNEALGERLRDVVDRQDHIDLGLARLQQLTTQVVAATETKVPRTVDDIHRAYADDLSASISLTDERPGAEGPAYPTKGKAFIPQRFACVQQDAGKPIHDESFWANEPVRDDVGGFLLRSFLAADAVHRPVLILGHPGSGKSLLSEMLAARLTPPLFTTIRVSLRETDAGKEIEGQIEDAVRKATSHQVSWIELSQEAEAPPIVIFDGLDELLLATGKTHVDFLDRLARFQHRQFVQERPVRIVVTSRLTLIHRMRVVDGTYVIRLLDFSSEQQRTWIDIWNGSNETYFATHELERFALPDNALVAELGAQPLLLLMLAIYDAYENDLAATAASSRAELYESIVEKFVERQRSKATTTGGAFRSLPAAKRAEVVAQDMQRLSIVALAMHKRASVHVTSGDLDADLVAYEMGGEAEPDDLFAITSAEALLGEFFFVHRSETEVDREGGGRSHAFEFLHNTFGEFLLALLIANRLGERCRALAWAASSPDASEVAKMEAAAAVLPADLSDALQWQLLCMRPVVLEMLGDLLARPRRVSDLAKATDLVARELRRCTSADDGRELQQRAVECANLLSIVAELPNDLHVVDCDDQRWRQIVGLLRGSLTFEELTQLASGFQIVVGYGVVKVEGATVTLSQGDVPGAVHRVAVALSDQSWLVATTRLATLDSLVPTVDRMVDRFGVDVEPPVGSHQIVWLLDREDQLLVASRLLRPSVWRRLDGTTRRLLAQEVHHRALQGLDDYPNAAIAALTTAWRFGGPNVTTAEVAQICRRSLGDDVEPEVVADLAFTVLPPTPVEDRTTFDEYARILNLAVQTAVSNVPPFRSMAAMDRSLVAWCWLVRFSRWMPPRQFEVTREVITSDLLRSIASDAPTFVWLPAAAWLAFEPSSPPEEWAEAWLTDRRATRTDLSVSSATATSNTLRALWAVLRDPDAMSSVLEKTVASGTTFGTQEWRPPDEMQEGWQFLHRSSMVAMEEAGLTLPAFDVWIADQMAGLS